MHELSIALSILDIAREESARRDGAVVATVHVTLGPLSGVVAEALQSAFELARDCSPFPACRLAIERTAVVGFCPACAADRLIESPQMLCCPVCGTPTPEIVSGRELEITAMEIEEPDTTAHLAAIHNGGPA